MKKKTSGGIGLRDWFAAYAMSGLLAGNVKLTADERKEATDSTPKDLARAAYQTADAMLRFRKEEEDDESED